jgi:hypothetical protein
MIADVVSEVRKGISGARIANQLDSNAGMMADLPEFIEFEVQVIGNYRTSTGSIIPGRQILSRVTDDIDIGQDRSNEVAVDTSGGTVRQNSQVASEGLETVNANKGSQKSDSSNTSEITSTEKNTNESNSSSRGESTQSSRDEDTKSNQDDSSNVNETDDTKRDQKRAATQVGTGKREQAGQGQGTRVQKRNIKQKRARHQVTGGNTARGYGLLETDTGVWRGQGQFVQPFRQSPSAGDAECG